MSQKILIVDDNIFNLKLLTDILQNADYEVCSTNDGLKVMEIVNEDSFDIILLDIIMPNIDGFEVCKILKADYDTKDIPIIMVTARTDSESIKKALDLGVFDYIKKPIEEVEVLARVQSALRFKAQLDQLKELSMKDGLTGLFNHSLLIELFEKELAKQERTEQGIGYVMLDIDHFKKVNDTFGHQAGDIVLRELSVILTNSIRKGDIIGRYGGEEFGIVFLSSSKDVVIRTCERIRKSVENSIFNATNTAINITISIGVCYKEPDKKILSHEMIRYADESLYRAKRNGRNRVEIAEF